MTSSDVHLLLDSTHVLDTSQKGMTGRLRAPMIVAGPLCRAGPFPFPLKMALYPTETAHCVVSL